MAKLWAGRFQKETDLVVNDFNSSILFDCRLYKEDITGSIAHATMLGKQGIIEEHEAEKIVEGLKGILKDIEDGKVEFSLDYEDIHMNVEQLLTERIGDTGKRLHTGRSRNDQVALDMRLYVKKEIKEIISWCSWEFKFVELDDAYSTGSSIMPQKKNPDVCELIRGKTGRVYGALTTMLTVLKGLPLAYNKDMQEDKEAVFGAIDTVKQCLEVFTPMFSTMTLRRDNMRKAASRGFINATDCADYLTKKGVPFRDAYKTVGRLVNQCIKADETLETMTMRDFAAISNKFGDDVYDALDLRTCVAERKVIGGPAPQEVTRQIDKIDKFIAEVEDDEA